MPRYSTSTELPLTIEKQAVGSIPAQLAEQIREHILAGTLKPGDLLPSSRGLASRLEISRGSVVAAYEQLAGEGYLSAHKGGTRVAENLELQKIIPQAPGESAEGNEESQQPLPLPQRQLIDLSPGTPDTSLLASSAWRSAWRKAAAEPGKYYPAAGSPELQVQLAEHLRLMRQMVREPAEILVTAGARDGFRLLLSALRQENRQRPLRIAVENPGYPSLHQIPAAFGHQIIPVAVDEKGLNPEKLPTTNRPDLVLVAPSHQYPLGASMPVDRRLELLRWAEENSAYIVEDDYDSELRYVGDPLPALGALARQQGIDRVVTLGSFTKTLTPGLGLGYMLTPRHLFEPVSQLREVLGSPVSALLQSALADFLAEGGVRRHIARMRRTYRRRRELLLNTLHSAQLPPYVRVLPMDGGLHVVLAFTGSSATEQHEARVVQTLAQAGVGVAALGDYWAHSGHLPGTENQDDAAAARGVVIGFGGAQERALLAGVKLLVKAL